MNKKIIVTILAIVLIFMIILTFVYREELFMQKVIITYPDRCVEIYENRELVTPICEEGRRLAEQEQNKTPYIPNIEDIGV